MKKLLFVGLIMLSFQTLVLAQSATAEMYIHTATGIDIYNLAEIDSITFQIYAESVTDIDGNVYQTVQIGNQVWMAENLKVTHYRNGDPIPDVTDNTEWSGLSTGAWCAFENDQGNVGTYGLLYNWYAVDDSRNIAPEGWHVPSDEEWKELEIYLGMSQTEADLGGVFRGTNEGGKLKETGTAHWTSPNTGATNESGFTALPGGARNNDGTFTQLTISAKLFSSTSSGGSTAWGRIMSYDRSDINRAGQKLEGFSVRCVKD